jgi:hypothetical protein
MKKNKTWYDNDPSDKDPKDKKPVLPSYYPQLVSMLKNFFCNLTKHFHPSLIIEIRVFALKGGPTYNVLM